MCMGNGALEERGNILSGKQTRKRNALLSKKILPIYVVLHRTRKMCSTGLIVEDSINKTDNVWKMNCKCQTVHEVILQRLQQLCYYTLLKYSQ